ncbi:response regulator [Paeniroseomonas aquatica]|uniref:Response regulator n=1 Tax=Paeniroseomonas aquatica TaxID=373043 RepID=A0ABT8A5P5_9PROT|nr:response regulator [Paeniroseomonas aquatica]MDN3564899.1 response regulator [Paeniroseomonas aquatica]
MAVLLVEDDTVVRLTLADFLHETGLEVLEACSADEAMRILVDPLQHVDILVTDLDLGPGDDGLVLASKARRRLPDLQVVYATGSPEKFVGHVLAPWEKRFAKPFDPTVLASTVVGLSETIDRQRLAQLRPAPAMVASSL